jgi:hypothetical protein
MKMDEDKQQPGQRGRVRGARVPAPGQHRDDAGRQANDEGQGDASERRAVPRQPLRQRPPDRQQPLIIPTEPKNADNAMNPAYPARATRFGRNLGLMPRPCPRR